jgi:protocatechuate 3,4-dioxygenase, alpha subunit
MKLVATGSQTVGPFFSIGFAHLCSLPALVEAKPVTVYGKVVDGEGEGVPDAVLELWQADPLGNYATGSADPLGVPGGFARIATDDKGDFSFSTCRPGAVDFDGIQKQAPHLVVLVFARGLLRHLITRMYFPDEPGNATDPLLQSLPDDRRPSLIARTALGSADTLQWDVVLQGENETVFFAW